MPGYLNPTNLTDAQLNVEVFTNAPDTDGDVPNPPGWDIGIKYKTATARNGFAFAVCADMTP